MTSRISTQQPANNIKNNFHLRSQLSPTTQEPAQISDLEFIKSQQDAMPNKPGNILK